MSNGSEQIEARLVAYIDGLLSEKERNDIEAYLLAHPDHRALIQELRSHKLQLGMLPREKAPADVMDHLQIHLERQALLENVDEAASSMRINRWPQVGAVAALLMLTAGLGILIYQVLPGNERRDLVLAPGNMQQLPPAPSLDEKEADAAHAAPGATERDATAAATPAPGEHRNDFVDNAAAELAKAQADKASTDKAMTLNNGSAIVVSTDDPKITQNLLANYLSQKAIPYEPVRAEAVVQSGPLNFRLDDDATRAALQSPPTEPIGSVVEKVNRRQRGAADSEVYVVARNVSVRQAEEISSVLNQQRGARQQATYYGNADLLGAQDLTVNSNTIVGNSGSQLIVGSAGGNATMSKDASADTVNQSVAKIGGGGGAPNMAGAGGENFIRPGPRTAAAKPDVNAKLSQPDAHGENEVAANTAPTTQNVGKIALKGGNAAETPAKPAGGAPAPVAVPNGNEGQDKKIEQQAQVNAAPQQSQAWESQSQQAAPPTAQDAVLLPGEAAFQQKDVAPSTQPGALAEPRTDVLIVLRAEVAGGPAANDTNAPVTDAAPSTTEPATQPTTAPATTQPNVGVSVEPAAR